MTARDDPPMAASASVPPRFRLESYRYRLPDDRIAQAPAEPRTASRLLVLDRHTGVRRHACFEDLPTFLRPGDCLVVNDTRVVPARLFATKPTGGRVELLVLGSDGRHFSAMFGTHRGLATAIDLTILDRDDRPTLHRVRVVEVRVDGTATFEASSDATGIQAACGHVPLPPYIRRESSVLHDVDRERYQTVYARSDGAVAAPTAGLHFTTDLLDRLSAMGVETARVTLHVGPGTFRPIKAEDVRDHDVGAERYEVGADAAARVNRALDEGRRVVAVGTTAVRTLETVGASGRVVAGRGSTRLFISPGYRFRVVGAVVTNFHLPGSSLLVLVSAFAGRRRVMTAYRDAVRRGYRFYSYGDAMLIA